MIEASARELKRCMVRSFEDSNFDGLCVRLALLTTYDLPRLDNELASEIIPCRHLIDQPLAGVRFHFDGPARVGFQEPGDKRLMLVYDDPLYWPDSHVVHSVKGNRRGYIAPPASSCLVSPLLCANLSTD
jgi:hypothetical protein